MRETRKIRVEVIIVNRIVIALRGAIFRGQVPRAGTVESYTY